MKKEGLTWIGRRTNQLRYGVNGNDQWLHPLSIYTAGEDIQRGHIVSVALPADVDGPQKITEAGISEDDNIVVKTRTDRHVKALGVAMETVTPGTVLHVLPFGRFQYGVAADEYTPNFGETDRGKLAYVSDVPGELTLDRDAAVLNTRNIIQIGFISNTDDTWPASGTLDIEVQLEGDGRGPLGNTQFEFLFGEPFSYTYSNGNRPVKVFALGQDVQQAFSYSLRVDRSTDPFPTGTAQWIAFYSNKQAHILIFSNGSIPVGTTQEDRDRLTYITQYGESLKYTPLYSSVTPPTNWGSPDTTTVDLYNESAPRFVNDLANAIADPSVYYLTGDAGSLTYGLTNIDIGDFSDQRYVELLISGTDSGGPIYVEWDSSLDRYFGQSAYIAQGAYNNAGKAVVADRRFDERTNVLGVLLNKEEKDYDEDTPGLFIRKGLFHTNWDAFTSGQEYYLGIDGNLTPFPQMVQYPDRIIKIGTAKNSNTLLVDVQEATQARVAGFPIGAMKPLAEGVNTPEYGFLLMDNHKEAQVDYPELFDELHARYGDDIVDGDDFIIPEMTNTMNGNYYQIKATVYGYEPAIESSVVKKVYGNVSSNGISDVDITTLSFAGPSSDFESPTLDRLDIKLYVNVPLSGGAEWRLLPEGVMEVGGTLYGYNWKIDSDGDSYILKMDKHGDGLSYFETSSPIALNGQEFRLLILKPDLFARYSEFDLDIAKLTLDATDLSKDMPINSKAVSDFIETGVTTNALDVRTNAVVGSGVVGDSEAPSISLTVHGDINITEKGDQSVTINAETGVIDTIAEMSPLSGQPNIATNTSLVTKKYVDDHRGEVITSSYPVHGIRQGHLNGFDADTVDGHHVGRWGIPVNAATIPEITTSGRMEVGSTIDFHATSADSADFTARVGVLSTASMYLQGATTTSFSLALGHTSIRRYLMVNSGQFEFLSQNTPGTNYTSIKASAFKTASSKEYKANIEVYKDSALDLFDNIEVVTYRFKNETETQVGFIAEDSPELLAGKDHDMMNLSSTVGLLIKAVQELREENRELRDRLHELEQRVD